MNVAGIDHFVLTVEDVETTCDFYEALGGDVVTFEGGRKAVRFGDQKINLHPAEGTDVELVAAAPTPGGGDFCLITDTPVEAVERRLDDLGIEVVRGPIERSGAVGPIVSVYFRDPDGNLVEIGSYADG